MSPKKTKGMLELGTTLNVDVGFNIFKNAASNSPLLDQLSHESVPVKLDGAISAMMVGMRSVGVTACALYLTTF